MRRETNGKDESKGQCNGNNYKWTKAIAYRGAFENRKLEEAEGRWMKGMR